MKLFFGHDQDGKLLAVDGRWVDTKGAAQYYGFSPATLRKKRSEQGKDGPFVQVKLGGKVLYDLFETDKNLEQQNNPRNLVPQEKRKKLIYNELVKKGAL